jgi:enolase
VSRIEQVHARQILDSRGNPTVEVDVRLDSGAFGRAAVPSGASTGELEAIELRDDGSKYGGKGVTRAVANVDGELAAAVRGLDADDQAAVDGTMIELDGTPNKARLGANAILGVSLAVARAAAADAGVPLYRWLGGDDAQTLPVPMMNVINGGAHAQNSIDLQEFMIVPANAATFADALRVGSETFHALRAVLHERGLSTAVGDEGGFAPDLDSSEEAITAILEAAERAGHRENIAVALDPAASEFFSDGRYRFERREADGDGMGDFYADLIARFPIVSIEDGVAEGDWDAWKSLTARLGERVQLVGDDVFVTNPTILRRGIDEGVANAILVKVNQIGTLTETLATIELARRDDRRSRGGDERRPDQDRLAVAHGSNGEVQPAAAHRGRTRRRGGVPGVERVPPVGSLT